MFMSRLPTIPSTSEYPGEMGFEISFGPLTESASKSATWTYSDVCKKLYVNLASFCPIKFKTHMPPPPGTVLRAVAVFKGSTNLHDIVKRCPNHMESSNDGTNIFWEWCTLYFFSKWHRQTRKKKFRVLPSGVEPKTFRLLVRMLYHWATGDLWELRPLN